MVVPMAGSKPVASLGKRIEALALVPLLFIVTLGIGWLVWCVIEWTSGRTPSYRILGLRVVRTSDDRPIRLVRSLARSAICLLLIIPTIVVCGVIGISFVFGASAPEELFRQPRAGALGSPHRDQGRRRTHAVERECPRSVRGVGPYRPGGSPAGARCPDQWARPLTRSEVTYSSSFQCSRPKRRPKRAVSEGPSS